MNNKIKIEQGKTTICGNAKVDYEKVKIHNNNFIDQMQQNFDNIENGYQNVKNLNNIGYTNQNNTVFSQNSSGFNLNNLATILPLLKSINNKNDVSGMNSILEMLPKLNGQQSTNQTNILSQLLPLILNSKKNSASTIENSDKKINSLKRVDED